MSLRLEASGIYKSYGQTPVLEDCSYSFGQGETYALMGPNGSGKSTLLRILSLLEEPDRGKVDYLSGPRAMGKDIGLRRRITLLLPGVGVFNTTVFKNAAYGLGVRGIKGDEAREKVERALELVGLKDMKGRNALTLSSGESRRLGIARALVIEPDVLFLDEPTAYIDGKNARLIEDIILGMKRETVIIATHDVSQAERLAGKVLLMRDGRLKA